MTAVQTKKWPGQDCSPAEPVSTKSREGNQMNMRNTSTVNPAPATISTSIEPEIMAALDGNEKMALYEALAAAADALQGVALQPRCYNDEGDGYNQAGEILVDLIAFFDKAKDRLVADAKATNSIDRRDNMVRQFLILRHEVSFMENMERIAAMSSGFVFERKEIEREQRRVARGGAA